MKDYKKLMPILLIFLAFIGIYSRVNDLNNLEKKYNTYLEEAREKSQEKIYVDAITSYEQVLKLRDTLAINMEIAQMFLDKGKDKEIVNWGEKVIEKYPKNIEGYEYLITYYNSQEKYEKCFEWYEVVTKRGLYSEKIEDIMLNLKYEYEFVSGGCDQASEFSGKYCVVSRDERYGLATQKGKLAVKYIYKQMGVCSAELIPVEDESGEFYFINVDGERKMNPAALDNINRLGPISNERYIVGNSEGVYYADLNGNIILGPYEDATSFTYERAAVKDNGLWYLIDLEGNKLSDGYLEFAEDVKEVVMRNGLAFARSEDGYVALDIQGKRVGKQFYEDAKCFQDNTYTAVKIDGLWGYIDNQCKIVIEPQYEDAKAFSNGLAAIQMDGLWGYIDMDGKIAVEPVFYAANNINSAGSAYVAPKENSWKLMKFMRFDYQ